MAETLPNIAHKVAFAVMRVVILRQIDKKSVNKMGRPDLDKNMS
jgi:hypothetical protein